MATTHRAARVFFGVLALLALLGAPAGAQLGKLVDPIERRPFKSVIELNRFLIDQKLMPEQAREFYRKAFVQINLNTGTRDEFLLIPGVGSRMSAEFAEYRPWKNWTQFDKEIGKYVGQQETDRLKQYVFIPPN